MIMINTMEELSDARLMVISKNLLEFDVIKRKVKSGKRLTIYEDIKRKLFIFLAQPHKKFDEDEMLLFRKYNNKCVICDSIYNPLKYANCFAICNKCVDDCINTNNSLVMQTYFFDNILHPAPPSTINSSTINYYHDVHINRLHTIVVDIISNYLKVVDIIYKFDHKIVLLLIMGRCDINFVFNMIPHDVVMYILWFIYDDRL